jgi:hypothetical protein
MSRELGDRRPDLGERRPEEWGDLDRRLVVLGLSPRKEAPHLSVVFATLPLSL